MFNKKKVKELFLFLITIFMLFYTTNVSEMAEYLGIPFTWLTNYTQNKIKTVEGFFKFINPLNISRYLIRVDLLILNIILIVWLAKIIEKATIKYSTF